MEPSLFSLILGGLLVATSPSSGTTETGVAAAEAANDAATEPTPSSTAPLPAELDAVQDELHRGLAELRLENSPPPYRAEVRTVRADLLSLDGSYGGLITNVWNRQAIGLVEVRVGSPARDNGNFFGTDSGVARLDVALEPSASYLRKKAWLGLDRAFRGASQSYGQKINALQRLSGENMPADYTGSPEPVTRIVEMDPTQLDRAGLAAMVTSLSSRFVQAPSIDNGDVHLQVLRSHETVLSTEQVALQWIHDRAVLAVVADTKAPDGMHLDHGRALHFDSIPQADDELLAAGEKLTDQVLQELQELTKAPVVEEEYDGPILFVGAAAPQFLASTIATEASGMPAPLADGGRMVELEPAWQNRLGKTVMPPWIDLVDDPAREGFGRFDLDAEGVRPTKLNLVEAGVLQHLLMTRTPNDKVSGSNGRARMSPSLEVGPSISNLALESSQRGLSPTALRRELLRRAREDGYEIAYEIELLRDGSILGPVPRESAAAYAGTGKINLPLPARVWRVEADGTKTLVRGAVLAPASMRVLRRIRAVGTTDHTERMRVPVGAYGGFSAEVGIDGVLSQTVDIEVSSPDLLIEGLELLIERGEHERLPTLTHPLRR